MTTFSETGNAPILLSKISSFQHIPGRWYHGDDNFTDPICLTQTHEKNTTGLK